MGELKRKKFPISPLPQALIALIVHRVQIRHQILIAPAVMNLPKEIAITSPRKIILARNLIRRKNLLLLLTKPEKEKKELKINYKNIWLKPKNVRRKVENDNNKIDEKCLFKKTQCFYAKNKIN